MESKGGHYGILDIFADHGIIDSIYYDRNWKILYEKTPEKSLRKRQCPATTVSKEVEGKK